MACLADSSLVKEGEREKSARLFDRSRGLFSSYFSRGFLARSHARSQVQKFKSSSYLFVTFEIMLVRHICLTQAVILPFTSSFSIFIAIE